MRYVPGTVDSVEESSVSDGRLAVMGLLSYVLVQGNQISALKPPNSLFFIIVEEEIPIRVINLLPLPALDGGSLALILVEAARGGRKLPC